jgi:hypothetical protein
MAPKLCLARNYADNEKWFILIRLVPKQSLGHNFVPKRELGNEQRPGAFSIYGIPYV